MATLAPSMAPSLLPSVTPIPSVLPSTFFTETPTTVTDYIASTTWQDILTVFYYQLIFAGFLWIVYEVARPRAKNIYYPRRRWQKLKVPPQPQPPRQFFAWIPPVFTMPGTETLNRVGLDVSFPIGCQLHCSFYFLHYFPFTSPQTAGLYAAEVHTAVFQAYSVYCLHRLCRSHSCIWEWKRGLHLFQQIDNQ